MPGYKPLADSLSGNAADQVREAEARHRAGDLMTAVQLLEEALEASVATRRALPGWLCGRLAALYRTLGRYDDEVHLLERYRESQTADDARTRYDARLSKARIIAERKRRQESKVIESVRASLGRPRARRSRTNGGVPAQVSCISSSTYAAVREALGDAGPNAGGRVRDALQRLCDEGRAKSASMDELVYVLKAARGGDDVGNGDEASAVRRQHAYGAALVRLLALYFQEAHDAE